MGVFSKVAIGGAYGQNGFGAQSWKLLEFYEGGSFGKFFGGDDYPLPSAFFDSLNEFFF